MRHLFFRLAVALVSVVTLMPVLAATDSALVTAAKDGDLRAVRALIAKRANVNEPARDGPPSRRLRPRCCGRSTTPMWR